MAVNLIAIHAYSKGLSACFSMKRSPTAAATLLVSVGVFGKLSIPLVGISGTVNYGSDGLGVQAGRSFGPGAGAAIKMCVADRVRGC